MVINTVNGLSSLAIAFTNKENRYVITRTGGLGGTACSLSKSQRTGTHITQRKDWRKGRVGVKGVDGVLFTSNL